MGDFEHSTCIQRLLIGLQEGEPTARAELLRQAEQRLHALAQKMLHRRPSLRGWEQTDDVFQKAAWRLHQSLAKVHPTTVREFFGLAALQIRWVLADLARELDDRCVQHGIHSADSGQVPADLPGTSDGPANLAEWTEFHESVKRLPAVEREMVDLLWYGGLTQEEAAHVLNVSLRTVKRRWLAARALLGQALGGAPPGYQEHEGGGHDPG